MDNRMLEILFMVKNGTNNKLTTCWSTFMYSTSSYDAKSKRYAIFKMARQCWVCEKLGKPGTKFCQVLDIFQLHQLELNPSSTTFGWEGCSHRASAVCSKEWRRLPRLRFFPIHVLAVAPAYAIVNMLNKREESGEDCTPRGWQWGPTRSKPYASKCLIGKKLPPNCILMLGPRVCQPS
jgi:hypothetical protein